MSGRKPHAELAGFVCERKARLGGHVVVYDRSNGFDCDADERWIVQHEPGGRHVTIVTERAARETMKALAEARTLHEAQLVADVFPVADDRAQEPPAAARSARATSDLVDRYFAAETSAEERAIWVELTGNKRGGRP